MSPNKLWFEQANISSFQAVCSRCLQFEYAALQKHSQEIGCSQYKWEHLYIPTSPAALRPADKNLTKKKNSTKVTQPPPKKINLIWKNRFNFLLSRISSLVQLTADMWEFVTYHSLGAGTATWNGRGCIHNADLPALSWQRGGLQEVPQQPKVILVSLNKVTFPLTRLHKPHKNCWARWLPHLSFHGTVLTQYKCVRNKFWKKQGYFFRVSVGYNSFR